MPRERKAPLSGAKWAYPGSMRGAARPALETLREVVASGQVGGFTELLQAEIAEMEADDKFLDQIEGMCRECDK
jgi:hypothetical protein